MSVLRIDFGARIIASGSIDPAIQSHGTHGSYVIRNKLSDMDLWVLFFQGNWQQVNIVFRRRWQNRKPKGRDCLPMVRKGQVTVMKFKPVLRFQHFLKNQLGVALLQKQLVQKKRKPSDFDKAFQLIKMTEMNCHEDALYEAVANMEEVKNLGYDFIAKCIKWLIKESLDKMLLKLENDA
ncbi:unnamed protein product [Rhodiola kirilowii]